MNDETSIAGVHFSPDFAARVLTEANRIVRRRRWLAATSGIAAVAVLLAVGLWDAQSARNLTPRAATPVTQIANAGEFSWTEETQRSDPLQWMFPDAQPVAQFAKRYSEAMMGNATQRQRMLFADDGYQSD